MTVIITPKFISREAKSTTLLSGHKTTIKIYAFTRTPLIITDELLPWMKHICIRLYVNFTTLSNSKIMPARFSVYAQYVKIMIHNVFGVSSISVYS